jgi:hypothetical protein
VWERERERELGLPTILACFHFHQLVCLCLSSALLCVKETVQCGAVWCGVSSGVSVSAAVALSENLA